jgi:hypothetical protein
VGTLGSVGMTVFRVLFWCEFPELPFFICFAVTGKHKYENTVFISVYGILSAGRVEFPQKFLRERELDRNSMNRKYFFRGSDGK